MLTAAGLITVERMYLRCPACHEGDYRGDLVLGIEEYLSPRMRELAYFAGTSATSFEHAAELLWRIAGLRISDETVRQHCYAQGERLCREPVAPAEMHKKFHEAE